MEKAAAVVTSVATTNNGSWLTAFRVDSEFVTTGVAPTVAADVRFWLPVAVSNPPPAETFDPAAPVAMWVVVANVMLSVAVSSEPSSVPVVAVDKSIVDVFPVALLFPVEGTVVVNTGVIYTVDCDCAAPAVVEEEAGAAADVDAVEAVFVQVSIMHCCIT